MPKGDIANKKMANEAYNEWVSLGKPKVKRGGIMNLSILEKNIENNNIDEAKSIIKNIGRNKYTEAVPLLIKYLMSTDNSILRNTIAMALSDIGSTEAVEPIINMIKHPKTIGNRGTLLYALEPFDYSAYIELLVELLNEDNFEVSRQSLTLIKSIAKDISEEIRQRCITKIKNEIENLQDKIDFLSESLDVLIMLNE